MGGGKAEARGGSLLRSLRRRTLSAWHHVVALAPRQIAEAMHHGAAETKEGEFTEAADVTPHASGVPFSASAAPARYNEPVIRMRGGGSRSSLPAALMAASMFSRALAGMPLARATSAKASAEKLFSVLGTGTVMTRRARPAKLRRKPMGSLVDS